METLNCKGCYFSHERADGTGYCLVKHEYRAERCARYREEKSPGNSLRTVEPICCWNCRFLVKEASDRYVCTIGHISLTLDGAKDPCNYCLAFGLDNHVSGRDMLVVTTTAEGV